MLVGSEGTLAIVTKVWVRLTPNPQDYRTMRAIFDTVDDATNAVSEIIAAGIIPAAMELMDQGIMAAVEEAFHFGFPLDAGAMLVIEVDGPTAGLDEQQQQIVEFCQQVARPRGAAGRRRPSERELLWKCRKMAVGASGRLSPSYMIQDGVVPRTQLPHILRRIAEIGAQAQRADRQRGPRRRRQRASDPAVRRARPRAGRAGRGRRPRDCWRSASPAAAA